MDEVGVQGSKEVFEVLRLVLPHVLLITCNESQHKARVLLSKHSCVANIASQPTSIQSVSQCVFFIKNTEPHLGIRQCSNGIIGLQC